MRRLRAPQAPISTFSFQLSTFLHKAERGEAERGKRQFQLSAFNFQLFFTRLSGEKKRAASADFNFQLSAFSFQLFFTRVGETQSVASASEFQLSTFLHNSCPLCVIAEVAGGQRPEVRGRRPEVRGRRSEIRGQRSEVGDRRSEGNHSRGQDFLLQAQFSEVTIGLDAKPETRRLAEEFPESD